MKYLISILVAIFIAGCVNTSTVHPDKTIKKNNGAILASITKSGGADDVWFFYRKVGEKKEKRMDAIGLTMIGIPDDFPNDDSKDGRVLVFEEPPGEYELTKWMIYDFGVNSYKYIYPKNIEPIRFSVKPNEITYLGNLHVNVLKAKNIFGVPIVAGGVATIRDNYAQDVAIFKKKYPKLSNLPIRKEVKPIVGWGMPR